MNDVMIFTSEDGKNIKCNIIATFELDGTNYIAYTDGTMNNGEEELYVSKYKLVNEEMKLEEITSEYEWGKVDKYLDDYVLNGDEEL